MVVVLQQVFALIQTVLSKWLNDSQVVEVSHQHVHPHTVKPPLSKKSAHIIMYNMTQYSWACVLPQAVCAIFEKSVKTLLHDFAPMVSQLSEMLGQMYSTIPQASALDLTRQVHTGFMCTHTRRCTLVFFVVTCRQISEICYKRAVHELISYASVSPRLTRKEDIKSGDCWHPQ